MLHRGDNTMYSVAENSIFGENDILTPVTPNDPRLTFHPIT